MNNVGEGRGYAVAGGGQNYSTLRNNEVITNAENLIFLANGGHQTRLSDRFADAHPRSLGDKYGTNGWAAYEVYQKAKDDESGSYKNFFVASVKDRTLILDTPDEVNKPFSRRDYRLNGSDVLEGLNTFTVVNEGDIKNPSGQTWTAGRQNDGAHYAFGGGHISILGTDDITNKGDLKTYGNTSGGSINIAAKGSFVNTFFGDLRTNAHGSIEHGGSIIVRAGDSILNFGEIEANADDMGGSITLLACNDLLNFGDIEANATSNGSSHTSTFYTTEYEWQWTVKRVRIHGHTFWIPIKKLVATEVAHQYNASGAPTGGIIVAKAGDLALNLGTMQANAGNAGQYTPPVLESPGLENGPQDYRYSEEDGGNGIGGYVHLHGGNVAANVDLGVLLDLDTSLGGLMEANGSSQGGQVLLTAGGGICGTSNCGGFEEGEGGFPDFVLDIFGSKVPGFSTTQLTPPVTTLRTFVDLAQSESALNFGHINAFGGSEGGDGKIILAGNGQVGVGDGASFNGVTVDYSSIMGSPTPSTAFQNQLIAVEQNGGRVFLVAGQEVVGADGKTRTAVESVLCANGALDEEGGIPGSRFPQDFTLPDPDGGFDFDTNGLFQEDRFVADDGLPGTLARLILAFQDGNMFLAQGYTSVTQEILSLALEEFNRLIADGATPAYAAQQLAQTLEQAGVDADVAQELVDAIANGDFTADDSVVNVLKQMANAGDGQQISKL